MNYEVKGLVLLDVYQVLSMAKKSKASDVSSSMALVLFHEYSTVSIEMRHGLHS